MKTIKALKATDNILVLILFVVVAMQVFLLCFSNLFYGEQNIYMDSAMEYVHAIEMSNRGGGEMRLWIPGWNYTSTMELDTPMLLAIPLLRLTGDIYLSFGLATILILCIWLFAIYMVLGRGDLLCFLLAVAFILVPYQKGMLEYLDMLFMGYAPYAIKVLLPLLAIALLMYRETSTGRQKAAQGILFILYIFFLTVSTLSSGIYVFVCGIFPVFAGYFLYKIYLNELPTFHFYKCALITVVCVVVGFAVGRMGGIEALGDSMTLCPLAELSDNIVAVFWGMFQVFGGVSEEAVEVVSVRLTAIDFLVRMLFVMLLLLGAVIALKKAYHKKLNMQYFLLLAIFIWNSFVLCVCRTSYEEVTSCEYRYHLMGVIPLICLSAAMYLLKWKEFDKNWRYWKCFVTLCTLLMLGWLNVTSYWRTFHNFQNVELYHEICKYATERNYDAVYFFGNQRGAAICRLLDYESGIVYLAVDEAASRIYTVDYYTEYDNDSIVFDNMIYVVNIEKWPMDNEIAPFDVPMEQINRIGRYALYVTAEK